MEIADNKKVLQTYEKKIIDLSRRNRLLKYPKSARSIDFAMSLDEFQRHFGLIHEIEIPFIHKDILFLEENDLKNQQMTILDDSENKKTSIPWIPSTKPEGKKLITTLTSLRLDTKRKFEEHGLHTLFITVGKVQWKEQQTGRGSSEIKSEYDYNAPLLLIPVIIEDKRMPKKTIVRIYDEVSDITVNKVLSLLLEKEFGTRKIIINDTLLDDLPALMKDLSDQITNIFSEIHIPVNITNDIQIGQYTFYGQQIYEDIKVNEDIMLENEFLNALCTHSPLRQDSLSIPIESSDNFLTTRNDFNVMDADSSQLEVIERVTQGNNLNVQGPPGTGKSQTIVNLISNLIARNKKILLVCEKQVALEVVLNRLKESNLDKLCLPLFKYNADKRTFAKSILEDRNALIKLGQQSIDMDELNIREKNINNLRLYAKAIGANIDPLQKSIYWVHGEFAKHKKRVSFVIPWRGAIPLNINFEDYRNALNTLDDLELILPKIKDKKHENWAIIKKENYSPDLFLRIQQILININNSILQLSGIKSSVLSWKTLQEAQTYIDGAQKIISYSLPQYLKDEIMLTDLATFYEEAIDLIKKYEEGLEISTKSLILPSEWVSFDREKLEEITQNDVELSQLKTLNLSYQNLCNNTKEITQILKNNSNYNFIQSMTFSNLIKNKDVVNITSQVTSLKDWETLEKLEQAGPILQNISNINDHIVKNTKLLDKWGILESSLDINLAKEICQRFNKYNVINRIFSGQYKKDLLAIKSWCNAADPTSFKEFKEIAMTLENQLELKKKFELLMGNFNSNFMKSGHVLSPLTCSIMFEDVKKLISLLISMNIQRITPEYSSVVLDTHQESKIRLHQIITNLEKEYASILTILPDLNGATTQTFMEFTSYIEERANTIKIIEKIADMMPIILNDINDQPKTLNELIKVAHDVNNLVGIRDRYNNLAERISLSYDLPFSDCLTNSDQLITSLGTVHSLIQICESLNFIDQEITVGIIRKIVNEQNEVTKKIHELLETISSDFYTFNKLVISNEEDLTPWKNIVISDLLTLLDGMISDEEGFATWMQINKFRRRMSDLGFGWFIEDILLEANSDNLASVFAVALWQVWLNFQYEQNSALQNFMIQDHHRLIKEFKDLDSKSMKLNALRTLKILAQKVNEAKWHYSNSEKELIHQSQLKMRHKPIRKLVNEIGNQIILYKRCWMMSPLTLSSYIPFGTIDFDVVIFDEASQMRVEHALGSIARAKQVVIFGDENQLPPTSFFDVTEGNDEDESSEDYESILHATKEILPGADRLLSYHYRSKYEELISYSNHYIYRDELTTFPNPGNTTKPIDFVYLENGRFDGGKEGTRKNFEESEKVAELCIKHVKENPNKSLGVIAFSKSQESAIRDSVMKILEKHPECSDLLNEDSDNLEKFFIKNLESVQGDERDVIILSIGYGKDKQGNMYQRFGPINSNYGYRRLNVAVTRAKEKIICVTSIKATDIRSEGGSRGVILLQKYLEFAEYGMKVIHASKLIQNQNVATDSPFEEEVERSLQEAGFIVHRQVGASGYKIDLAIVNPKNESEYLLGIECDGATYHSSYSARMNDRIRQQNLERLGWKIYRIWSQHWINNSKEIIADIASIIR